MKKIKIFTPAFISCFCLFATMAKTVSACEEAEKHPIDIALEEKIDADSSTFGMMDAYEWAASEWDKLLNENYSALMKNLDKEDRERLRASQREWIKYRDLEFRFNENFWAGFDGSMYRIFPLAYQSNFVRERALKLGHYLESGKR